MLRRRQVTPAPTFVAAWSIRDVSTVPRQRSNISWIARTSDRDRESPQAGLDFGAERVGRSTSRHLVVDPSDTRLAVHARLIPLPQKIARLGFRSVNFQGPLAPDFGNAVDSHRSFTPGRHPAPSIAAARGSRVVGGTVVGGTVARTAVRPRFRQKRFVHGS